MHPLQWQNTESITLVGYYWLSIEEDEEYEIIWINPGCDYYDPQIGFSKEDKPMVAGPIPLPETR